MDLQCCHGPPWRGVRVCVHVCFHMCMLVYVHCVYMYARVLSRVRACVCVHTFTRVHIRMCMCAHACMCACVCICVYICMHMCVCVWGENYHCVGHICVVPILIQSLPTSSPSFGQLRKHIDEKRKWLAQDHTGSKWQSQNLNSEYLWLGQMLLKLTAIYFRWLEKNLFPWDPFELVSCAPFFPRNWFSSLPPHSPVMDLVTCALARNVEQKCQ